MEKQVNFGEALTAIKEGKMILRKGWNGKGLNSEGLLVFLEKPTSTQKQRIQRMSCLPELVSKNLQQRIIDHSVLREMIADGTAHFESSIISSDYEEVKYHAQMQIVDELNNIKSWVPSSSDILAEDWIVLEY